MADEPEGFDETARDWEGQGDDAWVDAWIERNKDALNVLLAEAEEDVEAGRCTIETHESVMARARARWATKSDG